MPAMPGLSSHRSRYPIQFAGLALTALLLAAALHAQPPATTGGYRGPERNGIYPDPNPPDRWPEPAPTLLWKHHYIGQGWAGPTVANGNVYVLGSRTGRGYLSCFSLHGERIFRVEFGPAFERRYPGIRSAVEVQHGRAFFATALGVVYCLDASTGQTLWSVDTVETYGNQPSNWGHNPTPLVADGKVIVSLRDARYQTLALDLATGKPIWTAPSLGYKVSDASPISIWTSDGPVVVETFHEATVARDLRTGGILWQHKPGAHTQLTPVHHEGNLLVRAGSDVAMLALAADGRSVTTRWTRPRFEDVSQAVILDDTLFVMTRPIRRHMKQTITRDGDSITLEGSKRLWFLQAWDVKTGTVLQSQRIYSDGSLCAVGDRLCMLEGGQGGGPEGQRPNTRLHLIQPTAEGFKTISRFSPEQGERQAWANPAFADGKMFYRHGDIIAAYHLNPEPQAPPIATP